LHGAPGFWLRGDALDERLQSRFREAEKIISCLDCVDYSFVPDVFVFRTVRIAFASGYAAVSSSEKETTGMSDTAFWEISFT